MHRYPRSLQNQDQNQNQSHALETRRYFFASPTERLLFLRQQGRYRNPAASLAVSLPADRLCELPSSKTLTGRPSRLDPWTRFPLPRCPSRLSTSLTQDS